MDLRRLLESPPLQLRRPLWVWPVLALATAWCAACGEPAPRRLPAGPPTVVVSIFPLGNLASFLAGPHVRVEVVLPPGAAPETFEPTPRQIHGFEKAALFVRVGAGLDDWLAGLGPASGAQGAQLVLSEGLPLLPPDPEHGDAGHPHEGNPHIWLDPVLVRDRLVPAMADALVSLVPQAEGDIRRRASELHDSLTALDQEIREALAPVVGRGFVATHPSFSYFAHRYGLQEVGVIHSHPGNDPSSRELARLVEEARRHGVPCVFVEPHLGETAARALAVELAIPTCFLDPLGGPGLEGRDSYLALLRFNTRRFLEGLGRDER